MKKGLLSIIAMAVLMVVTTVGFAQTTYTMVASASQLEVGANYILVGYHTDGSAYAMTWQMSSGSSSNRRAINVTESNGSIVATVATNPSQQDAPFEFTLGGSVGAWTIYDPLNNGYLYAPGGGNKLNTQATVDDKAQWTITDGEDGGLVPVSNGGVEQSIMRFNYNNGNPLFSCYKESSSVKAPVYFFKAGGAATPDPEPTNYPTNFAAELNMMNVTLTWTDATGAQLPARYLVVGSQGSITVPVDGTPVPDGALVKNVNYGVQTVEFKNLEEGTTYHFAIFPYTNGGANIDYKNNSGYPTVNVTTEDFYLYEDFNEGLGQFTAYSVAGDEEWTTGANAGVSFAKITGHTGGNPGENHVNEDWLISPKMTFPTGASFINVEFRTATKYDGNALQVKVSENYSGSGNPNAATWTDLTDLFDFSNGDWEWVVAEEVDLLGDFVNDNFHIAFIYTSDETAAATWEVDYVKITTDGTVGVSEAVASAISVYPNPARDVVRFNLESDAQVSVFDMTGRMVSTMNMTAGEASYQVADLESGVYFLNIRRADGKKEVARFVKF